MPLSIELPPFHHAFMDSNGISECLSLVQCVAKTVAPWSSPSEAHRVEKRQLSSEGEEAEKLTEADTGRDSLDGH